MADAELQIREHLRKADDELSAAIRSVIDLPGFPDEYEMDLHDRLSQARRIVNNVRQETWSIKAKASE